MLNTKSMWLVTNTSGCDTVEVFNSGNGQVIREFLLRQAVKSCDYHATDVLILLDCGVKKLFEKGLTELDIYFTQSSIEWLDQDTAKEKEAPELYRYAMKLVKEGDALRLFATNGNV